MKVIGVFLYKRERDKVREQEMVRIQGLSRNSVSSERKVPVIYTILNRTRILGTFLYIGFALRV